MNVNPQKKTALIKARVQVSTKGTLERIANRLDLDQSTVIRLALMDYFDKVQNNAA